MPAQFLYTLCLAVFGMQFPEEAGSGMADAITFALPFIVGFIAKDDSMAPLFLKGEVVYAADLPFRDDTVCLVEMPDGYDSIRIVRRVADEYVLTPFNPGYPEMRVSVYDIDVPMPVMGSDVYA